MNHRARPRATYSTGQIKPLPIQGYQRLSIMNTATIPFVHHETAGLSGKDNNIGKG